MRKLSLLAVLCVMASSVVAIAQDQAADVDELDAKATDLLNQLGSTADPASRDALIDQVIEIYRQIEKSKINSEPRRWKVYEGRRMIAHLLGVEKPSGSIQRILYLLAGPDEYERLAMSEREVAMVLSRLERDIDRTIVEYRRDRDRTNVMLYARHASDLQNRVKYTMAWAMLYRGVGMPPDDEEKKTDRRVALETAIKEIDVFLTPQFGEPPEAHLLKAIALRELGKHDDAARHLASADKNDTEPRIRFQAKFENARVLIEQGKFNEAPKAIDAFLTYATSASSSRDDKLYPSVLTAMLRNHLAEAKAKRQKDSAKVAREIMAGQKAFMDFIDEWDDLDVTTEFLNILGSRYREAEDRTKLGTVAMIAVARHELRNMNRPEECEKLLDLALSRKDGVSRRAHKLAWWERGYLYEQLTKVVNGRNVQRRDDAAREFLKVLGIDSKSQLAYQSALNAVVCFSGAMGDYASAGLNQDELRLEYIAAMEKFVKGWPKDPEAMTWYRNIGEQYRNLGILSEGERQRKNFVKAAEYFEKVPLADINHLASRRDALRYRFRALMEAEDASSERTIIADLIKRLDSFIADATESNSASKYRVSKEDLDNWAAQSSLDKITIQYELLDQQDVLRNDVDRLVQRWPNTPAALNAMEWEVRMLVQVGTSDCIDRAIRRVNEVRDRAPEQAERVIQLVVEQVRKRIATLKDSLISKDELEQYRKTYLEFARVLLERSAPEQAYASKQMYADALCEAGKLEESLKFWQECQSVDEERRQVKVKDVEAQYKPLLTQVKKIGDSESRAKKQAAEFLKISERLTLEHPHGKLVHAAMEGLKDSSNPQQALSDLATRLVAAWRDLPLPIKIEMEAQAQKARDNRDALVANAQEYLKTLRETLETSHDRGVRAALEALQAAREDEDVTPRVKDLAMRIEAGYKAIVARKKEGVDIDAYNILGLARVYHAMKDYKKAGGLYAQLARGVDPEVFPEMFWDVQLEMAQCLLEGFGDDTQAMRNLSGHIEQLRTNDSEMGGRRALFGMLEAKAKAASR